MSWLLMNLSNEVRTVQKYGRISNHRSFSSNNSRVSNGIITFARKIEADVMREMGIGISDHKPCQVDEYMNEDWDYVITVCDNADKTCPAFRGNVKHRLHMPFEDPSKVTDGTYEFKMNEYRRIRDEINDKFFKLYCEMEERKK